MEIDMTKDEFRHDSEAEPGPTPPFSDTIKDSAQQIWLAGLGAFAKAQEEGGKVFEKLVKEGVHIQRSTQAAAEERMADAASKMSRMTGLAGDLTEKAGDKLESIFEARVARALVKLGTPSSLDVQALQARIDALEAEVAELRSGLHD
jgi:poly(hydroxyalkanoate) granule-associated protein